MKTIVCLILLAMLSLPATAQSILGKWQLLKETDCMDQEMSPSGDTEAELRARMRDTASPGPSVVTFKEKMQGEETTRLLTRRKPSGKTRFLYKFNGESLWILDKRSRTITESFVVEKLSADSLIIASSSRPCETRVFVRLE